MINQKPILVLSYNFEIKKSLTKTSAYEKCEHYNF